MNDFADPVTSLVIAAVVTLVVVVIELRAGRRP